MFNSVPQGLEKGFDYKKVLKAFKKGACSTCSVANRTLRQSCMFSANFCQV